MEIFLHEKVPYCSLLYILSQFQWNSFLLSFYLQLLLQSQNTIRQLLQMTRYFQSMQTTPLCSFLTFQLFHFGDIAFLKWAKSSFSTLRSYLFLTCDLNSCNLSETCSIIILPKLVHLFECIILLIVKVRKFRNVFPTYLLLCLSWILRLFFSHLHFPEI